MLQLPKVEKVTELYFGLYRAAYATSDRIPWTSWADVPPTVKFRMIEDIRMVYTAISQATVQAVRADVG